MKSRLSVMALALLVFFGVSARAGAQETDSDSQSASTKAHQPKSSESKPSNESEDKEKSSVTQHTASIGGQTISYTAAASTTLLKNDKGQPEALMYSTAYTENGIKDLSRRPVIFLYNGGPGSASIWLHMGAWGPRRVVTGNAAPTPSAPYQLVDNQYSLLDKADLVFIDPIGTGFSHAVGKTRDSDFWGVKSDVESLAQFISIYLSRNHRWNSPKLLYGESYGTFRSVALCNYLQEHDGIYLNGIVLQSSVLDLGTIDFGAGDDRSYILYLPSYAAIAWHYNLVKNKPASLPAFMDQVRKFASGEYAGALMKGTSISDAEKNKVAQQMADYTGLDVKYILKANLRVTRPQFRAELLRSRGVTIGYYDGRYTSPTYDLLEENAASEPSYSAIVGAFTAAFNSYVRDDLKFGEGMIYKVLPNAPSQHWKWKSATNAGEGWPTAPNVEPDLISDLLDNANLQVQVENGYFDLSTPFFATEFTMNHLLLPKSASDRIHFEYYDAGHMMYLRESALQKLAANVRAFITQVSRH
ncbi:MAG: S10 family peptidase [Candidatus Acidiferrales bacterium]